MKIQIEPHTFARAEERGVSMEEIEDVLENGLPIPAKCERQAKYRIYPFEQDRLGKYYEQKRVEVIYTRENDLMITITVYAFYGEWKE